MDSVPPALPRNLLHNHVLQHCVLLLTIRTGLSPRIAADQRLAFEEVAPGMARAVLTFGFFEEPNVPAALAYLPEGWRHPTDETSYIFGRLIAITGPHPGMARWREAFFRFMLRLAGSTAEYFRLPPNRTVELGIEVEI
jgi:KUP system potassium uptake protein